MNRIFSRALTALVAVGALLLTLTGACPSPTATAVPAQDACRLTDQNAMPVGDCGAFKQLYRDSFTAVQVPEGAFSACAGDGDHRCSGLKVKYPGYYSTLGAYPDGWPDTATSGADGNGGRTSGGYYRPQDTMSVIRQPNGDGQMRVRMWRPAAGGSVHSSAPVPLKCMNLRYGKFTERFVVRTTTAGYKMAHLHYSPDEIDYPEAGGNFASDPVSLFTHGFTEYGSDVAPNSTWRSWHTYSQEITPSGVKAYLDGKLVASASGDYPRATDWILQNESALAGAYAAPGSSVIIDSTWLSCYRYAP